MRALRPMGLLYIYFLDIDAQANHLRCAKSIGKLEQNATEDRQNYNKIQLETNAQILHLKEQLKEDHHDDILLFREHNLEEHCREIVDIKV